MPPKKTTAAPKSPKTPKNASTIAKESPKKSNPKKDSGKKASVPKKKSNAASKTKAVTPYDILLYIPNIIGYFRAICMFLFFWLAPKEEEYSIWGVKIAGWKIAVFLYAVGFVGDLVDGWAARKFNQSTLYGATLDMVVDRVATAGLLCILASLKSENAFFYASLIVLDIGSHWFHMASTVTKGHHKDAKVLQERNYVLRLYYGSKPFFGFCCVGQEFYYIHQFINSYENFSSPFFIGLEKILLVACLSKQVVNFFQLASAVMAFAEQDAKDKNKKK